MFDDFYMVPLLWQDSPDLPPRLVRYLVKAGDPEAAVRRLVDYMSTLGVEGNITEVPKLANVTRLIAIMNSIPVAISQDDLATTDLIPPEREVRYMRPINRTPKDVKPDLGKVMASKVNSLSPESKRAIMGLPPSDPTSDADGR